MARRSVTEEVEYPVLDPVIEDAAEQERVPRRTRTPKKEKAKDEAGSKLKRINLFYWTLPFLALAGAFLLTMAFHRVEEFLITDVRFHFQGPAEYGQDPQSLKLTGLNRASRAEVLRVFEPDLERSLYLFPVAERRRNLLAVDWVKEATVSRRWPNQVHVALVEREAVAFAQINVPDAAPRFQLIDAEGVLLPIPRGEEFKNLVVLTGLSGLESEGSRKVRVQQASAMLRNAGPLASHISEVDIRDPGNLQATMQLENRVVMVRLGSRNFHSRLQNFVTNYPEIQRARPAANTFDLRIDDRITAVDGGSGGE